MPRWTEESRKAQAERIKSQTPWMHSTGPQTEEGKARCSKNATRHGMRSEVILELKRVLRAQAAFVKRIDL